MRAQNLLADPIVFDSRVGPGSTPASFESRQGVTLADCPMTAGALPGWFGAPGGRPGPGAMTIRFDKRGFTHTPCDAPPPPAHPPPSPGGGGVRQVAPTAPHLPPP